MMFGTLYLVAVPIGNPRDITLRALDVLRECAAILCEDLKPARRLLHELFDTGRNDAPEPRPKFEKELLPLNEHTARKATDEALEMLLEGKSLALISDAGTPLIADPGSRLVQKAIESGIEIIPLPGASSLLAALVVSGFPLESFLFAGFLPRDKEDRKRKARELAGRSETIVLLEAPYRLSQLLDDLVEGFGPKREAALAIELTLPKERVIRGSLLELREQFQAQPFKGEFVVVLRGAPHGRTGHGGAAGGARGFGAPKRSRGPRR